VTNGGTNSVSVIDTATNTVVATVTVGSNPSGVALNSRGTRVYVTNRDSDSVSVIDTVTNAVLTTLQVGGVPLAIAVR